MKKLVVCALLLSMTAAICGCTTNSTAGQNTAEASTEEAQTEETQPEETQTEEAQAEEAETDSTEDGPKTIFPFEASADVSNLTDCTVPVYFTTDSFDWMGGNFTVEVCDTLCYDVVDVASLQVGDSIDTGDDGLVEVMTITDSDAGIVINEGEGDELVLVPAEEGGIYHIVYTDDEAIQRSLGETELVLAEDVVLNDSIEDPQETKTVSADELKEYMESLEEPYNIFDSYSTTVVIENGEVTEINRVWIP